MQSESRTPQTLQNRLIKRIAAREAVVGIVGLGYVGLPLAMAFHEAGFTVVGFDVDEKKVETLLARQSYIRHLDFAKLVAMIDSGRFIPTSDFARISECDAVILCVPTPLTRNREPDMSFVVNTGRTISPYLKPGQLVCLESTTYPGTTEEVLIPAMQESAGFPIEQLFVAYSPEREDPSNKEFSTATIPKVIGGMTPESLTVAKALYDTFIVQTVPVSSCRAAEAAKLVENIFRCVNIAMVNELKLVFERMDIDIWEVIDAAKTKPFGYMPFYPGPGLGGHCIPIDPFYLTWKAREYDMPTKFIELAGEINTQMPYYVVARTMEVLNEHGKALRGSHILLVGLAYKPDVDDQRESPTFKLMELLEDRGAVTDYHDPHIPIIPVTREHAEKAGRKSVAIESAGDYDLVLISTAHSAIDYPTLAHNAKLVVDTRNAMEKAGVKSPHVFKA